MANGSRPEGPGFDPSYFCIEVKKPNGTDDNDLTNNKLCASIETTFQLMPCPLAVKCLRYLLRNKDLSRKMPNFYIYVYIYETG